MKSGYADAEKQSVSLIATSRIKDNSNLLSVQNFTFSAASLNDTAEKTFRPELSIISFCFYGICSLKPDNNRYFYFTDRFIGFDNTVCYSVASYNAAEDIYQNCFYRAGSLRMILNPASTVFAFAPPPTSRKVGRFPSR